MTPARAGERPELELERLRLREELELELERLSAKAGQKME